MCELLVIRILGDTDDVNTISSLHLSLHSVPLSVPSHSLLQSHARQKGSLRIRLRIVLSVKSCQSLSEKVSSTPSSRHRRRHQESFDKIGDRVIPFCGPRPSDGLREVLDHSLRRNVATGKPSDPLSRTSVWTILGSVDVLAE